MFLLLLLLHISLKPERADGGVAWKDSFITFKLIGSHPEFRNTKLRFDQVNQKKSTVPETHENFS